MKLLNKDRTIELQHQPCILSLIALNFLITFMLFSIAFLTRFCRSADYRQNMLMSFSSLLPRLTDRAVLAGLSPSDWRWFAAIEFWVGFCAVVICLAE